MTLAELAAEHVRRRAAEKMDRIAMHLELLERYGLTPDTCPVCRLCPILP